jgi:hypothetical protein
MVHAKSLAAVKQMPSPRALSLDRAFDDVSASTRLHVSDCSLNPPPSFVPSLFVCSSTFIKLAISSFARVARSSVLPANSPLHSLSSLLVQ